MADATPPFWPRVVETAGGAIGQLPPDRPVVLVAHSNAGLFLPVIVEAATRPIAGCLFGWDVDHVPGQHLHQLVDPEAVTSRILAMSKNW